MSRVHAWALLPVLALGTVASGGEITLSAQSGRTWIDDDFDGDFTDGVGTTTATSLATLSNVGQYAYRGGVEFDLTSLAGQVESATLSLSFGSAHYGNPTIELHGYESADGDVSAADVRVTNLLATVSPPADYTWTVDVTSFISGLVASGSDYAGFSTRITNDLSPSSNSGAFYFSPNATSLAPQLNVTLVPLPPAAWMGLGLLGAMGLIRRVRSRRPR